MSMPKWPNYLSRPLTRGECVKQDKETQEVNNSCSDSVSSHMEWGGTQDLGQGCYSAIRRQNLEDKPKNMDGRVERLTEVGWP